ncbi:hypothetical protein FRC12_018814 [Ceratobasidium sp. 428]|nr:hypothetical protein FRC12_018814 [Ceratobasidium sp. 428]
MFTKQNVHGTSLSYFLIVARITMLIRFGLEAPVDSFEMSQAEYRRMIEAIEPSKPFNETDADLSAVHDAFVRYIVVQHESRTTLDGFKNMIEYFDAHAVHFDETGVDLGVTFDRDELGLARAGTFFGEPLLQSVGTPLSKPRLRAAKFVHAVIRSVGDRETGMRSLSFRMFRCFTDVETVFERAGIVCAFSWALFVPDLERPEGYPQPLVWET